MSRDVAAVNLLQRRATCGIQRFPACQLPVAAPVKTRPGVRDVRAHIEQEAKHTARPVSWHRRTHRTIGCFWALYPSNTRCPSIPATRFSHDSCHIPAPGPHMLQQAILLFSQEPRAHVAVIALSHARLSVQLVHVCSATLRYSPLVTSRPSQVCRRTGAIGGEAS